MPGIVCLYNFLVSDTTKTVHDVEREEQVGEEYRDILKKREMLLRYTYLLTSTYQSLPKLTILQPPYMLALSLLFVLLFLK